MHNWTCAKYSMYCVLVAKMMCMCLEQRKNEALTVESGCVGLGIVGLKQLLALKSTVFAS